MLRPDRGWGAKAALGGWKVSCNLGKGAASSLAESWGRW